MMTTITLPPNKKKCIQKKLSFATPTTRLLEEPVPVDAPTQLLGNTKTGVQRKRCFVATPTKPVHVDAQSPLLLGNKTAVVEDPKPAPPPLEGRKTSKALRRVCVVVQPSVEAITELGDSGCTPDKTSSSTTDTDSSSSSPFPTLWTDEKWAKKKEEHPWLDCKDGKLGCKPCSSVPGLSVHKAIGAHLSDQWSSYNVAPSGKDRVYLLKNLRKKIGLHKGGRYHKVAEKIHATAKDQPFEKSCAVLNSAYYLAQKDRPFQDHYDLLKLEEKNGVEIGLSLHSRFSAANTKTGVQRKQCFVATPTKPVHVDAQSQLLLGNKTAVVEDPKPAPPLEGRKTFKALRRLSVVQPSVEAITELGDSGCTPDKTSSSTTDTDSSSSSPFPALWTDEKWAKKKEEHPWLDCKDGKLGCKPCSSVPGLSVHKAIGAHLSDQWSSYNVAPSGKDRLHLLKNLRKKIGLHKGGRYHKAAEKILATAKDQPFEKSCAVFNSAYYLAQKDRPFQDHYDLLKLQEKNGVEIGLGLHSRFSAAKIADHVGSEMRKNICKIIQAIEGKISIMIDESTTKGDKTTLIVYLNCETEKNLEPHTVFLDLIELPNQKAETITNNLLKCLTGHGFDHAYLKKHLIAFASDGASVMLGHKSGVAKQLSDRYPNILTWHCLNHRLELAVGDTAKDVSGVNHLQIFMDKLYSVACERGFRQMNLIITPIRTKLLVKRVSALMFIKLHGPPVEDWDPTDYVISWNRYHRLAEDTRTRAVPDTHKVIPDRCWKFL